VAPSPRSPPTAGRRCATTRSRSSTAPPPTTTPPGRSTPRPWSPTQPETEAFLEFHDALFAEQPAEGGPGLTDQRLGELAAAAGATGAGVGQAITGLVYEDWTRQVTDAASRAGITGTPTVLVDGEPLAPAQLTPAGVTDAVTTAAEG
jgi:protein-disulfide isomerase